MTEQDMSAQGGARYEVVFDAVSEIVEAARRSAARSVNATLTAAYWLIGRHLVELEREGSSRAAYGAETVGRLAADLSPRYGRGFSIRNIRLMREFYLSHPTRPTLSAESEGEPIRQTASAELMNCEQERQTASAPDEGVEGR